jgi:leader peptidase (prepilin peptidase) / N-methyltransferase
MSLFLQIGLGAAVIASPFLGRYAARFVRGGVTEGTAALEGCHSCSAGHSGRFLILSWIPCAGRCRLCGAKVPLAYPAMEIAFLGVALWVSQLEPQLVLPGLLLGWGLVMLAAFDVRYYVLPNILTYSLIGAGLALTAAKGGDAALESAAGALAGAGSLLAVKLCYRMVTKRDGLGMGDVKLFAAAGAWVGASALPSILLTASLLGLVFGAFASGMRGKAFLMEKIPFGAPLCAAIWIAWINSASA